MENETSETDLDRELRELDEINVDDVLLYDLTKEKGKVFLEMKGPRIVVIDPGIYNCGISYYDINERKFIKVFKKSFLKRPSNGEKKLTDNGNKKLISSVKKFIEKQENGGIFDKRYETFVFIENQTIGTNSWDSKSGKKKSFSFTNAKNQAVQNTFQIHFNDKCFILNSNSVKSYFREHFPLEKDATRERQYSLDKKNAIIFGKTLVPDDLKRKIYYEYREKQDDVYDSVVMTKYVEDCYEFKYKNKNNNNETKFDVTKKKLKRKTKKKPKKNDENESPQDDVTTLDTKTVKKKRKRKIENQTITEIGIENYFKKQKISDNQIMIDLS